MSGVSTGGMLRADATRVTGGTYDLGFCPSCRFDRPGRAKTQMQALAAGQFRGRTEDQRGKCGRDAEGGRDPGHQWRLRSEF